MKKTWMRLLAVADCPPGQPRFISAGGHELAVFHLIDPDRFVVTQNSCPHAGGNLSAGDITGSVVVCPWHHWPFDVETGRCTLTEQELLRRYPCRVKGGYVWAEVGPCPRVGGGL